MVLEVFFRQGTGVLVIRVPKYVKVAASCYSLWLLPPLFASAAAHATWQGFWIGYVDADSSCVRLPVSNSPVTDVTSDDIACNAGATASAGVCSVTAGDAVTMEMHQQPNDRNHYGPVIVYMAAVDDVTTAVSSEADNCGHYTFNTPTDIAPSNHLLRTETIALHVASAEKGAQHVSGTGTAAPDTVSLPCAYSAEGPGILINIYTRLDTYTVLGPILYGITKAAVATASYATTATWDTASQPSTVPTTVPTSS
ncbi:glycosyl hydrolase family 61-domain-containing protein [Desarmillaria ectypa]|nr:glycosyl hydrolase family 61-domain-containing protein [Desarmillaria ectypa]